MAFARQPRLLQTLTTAVLNETLNLPKILRTTQGLIAVQLYPGGSDWPAGKPGRAAPVEVVQP
jgi:hypothetical protein